MKWFNIAYTPVLRIGTLFFVRLRQFYVMLVLIAGVVLSHTNLLHFGEFWNDLIALVCLILLGLNHSVVEK